MAAAGITTATTNATAADANSTGHVRSQGDHAAHTEPRSCGAYLLSSGMTPAALTTVCLCPQSWVGTVTELIPPNYGIVDGEAFFVHQIVVGTLPQVVVYPCTAGHHCCWHPSGKTSYGHYWSGVACDL